MINHKHKFIFIHIPKCAGSSLHGVFRQYGDDSDFNYGHPTFQQYCDKYKQSIDYTKIISIRNPWDRLLSTFYYLKGGGNGYFYDIELKKIFNIYETNFKDWVVHFLKEALELNLPINHFKPISFYISKKDIDYVIRTENIQEDFDIVCDKIGIPKQELPYINKSKHKHYTEYYDDETKQIVAEKYAKDIEYFGYKFGG